MRIFRVESEEEFFNLVAWRIASEIINVPDALIGFSTGRTTKGIHASLADIYKSYKFDTSKITVFGLDEITNVSREYSGSCYYILLKEVVEPLGIPIKNFIMPPTYSDDIEKECRNYEDAIYTHGPVSLQILGIGENGHIGFNQPGTHFGSVAWLSRMDEELEKRIYRETNSPPNAQLGGLTLGIKNIMQSKKIILAANGSRKAKIIHDAIYGPVTEELPASILQLHPDCDVILDAKAGNLVQKGEIKHEKNVR